MPFETASVLTTVAPKRRLNTATRLDAADLADSISVN